MTVSFMKNFFFSCFIIFYNAISAKRSGPGCSKADECQLFFHIFSFLVKASFAYSCFSKSTSSDVKFCRISALNNTLELRNKLLG